MDFHELEAFIVVANSLHFAKAAATLHMSPSTLSRLVSRLEDELGAVLLERDTRTVTLTPQGTTFLGFSIESLRNRDELRLGLTASERNFSGTLKIFASVTACYSILPPFIKALGECYPLLRPSVETGDPADAYPSLHEGRSDMVLAAIPPGGFGSDECFSVRRTPLVFVASKDGPYGKMDFSGGAARLNAILGKEPLILPHKGLSRDRFDRWMRRCRQKPHIVAEAAGNEAVLALTRLGLGLGLVPLLVLLNSPFAEGLLYYDAGEEFGDYDIGFVLPRAGYRGKLRTALRGLLGEVYPEGKWLKPEKA